jgi:hypothetical protein
MWVWLHSTIDSSTVGNVDRGLTSFLSFQAENQNSLHIRAIAFNNTSCSFRSYSFSFLAKRQRSEKSSDHFYSKCLPVRQIYKNGSLLPEYSLLRYSMSRVQRASRQVSVRKSTDRIRRMTNAGERIPKTQIFEKKIESPRFNQFQHAHCVVPPEYRIQNSRRASPIFHPRQFCILFLDTKTLRTMNSKSFKDEHPLGTHRLSERDRV